MFHFFIIQIFMGKIEEGILGEIRGKVGPMTGSSWNNIPYIRSLPGSFHDARTERQLRQRARFKAVIRFLTPLAAFVRLGYQQHGPRQSAYSAATSYLLRQALREESGHVEVDYDRALVSRGCLAGAEEAAVQRAGHRLTFAWTDNSRQTNASEDDVAMLFAYNPARAEAVYDTEAARRADGTATLAVPASWEEEPLAVYLSFRQAQGEEVSNSVRIPIPQPA